MQKQVFKYLRTWLPLVAALLISLGAVPGAHSQSEETPPQVTDFGPWTVSCTANTVYHYMFCDTYHNVTLSGASGDAFVRFGVTRTLGSERAGILALGGFTAGSEVVISVDGDHSWKFTGNPDKAVMANPDQSKEIIDQLLAGKTARVQYTPNGGTQQQMEVSLEKFSEALKHARAHAE